MSSNNNPAVVSPDEDLVMSKEVVNETAAGANETYVSRLQSLLAERPDIKWSLESKGSSLTKVSYTNTLESYPITSPEDLIARSEALESEELSICIIENISAEYVEALGTRWGIDPMFFVKHATNPDKEKLWWSRNWSWSPLDDLTSQVPNEPHAPGSLVPSRKTLWLEGDSGRLDGIFEYHNEIPGLANSAFQELTSSPNFINRHCFKDKDWPLQSNTRISYCRPNLSMCKEITFLEMGLI